MSAFDWLNSQAFTAFGQHVIYSDIIGNVIGLAALALGWRRSVLTWPVQVLSGVVLVGAYCSAQLAGGVGKQLLVIGRRRVGLAAVAERQAGEPARPSRSASPAARERALLAAGTALGTLAVGSLFTLVPSLSWNPWPDAYIFVGTLAAMTAQARGLVEFWFAWLLVDLVGVPLAFSSGLAFSGLVYVVYLGLVLWGLRSWWLRTRTAEDKPAGAQGAVEGAIP